ncbi:MAG TPA: MerR family transcriptional regulator, partial [Patescibacteria group bacterium]|nr:MerR family transcriptional regulator [Patescibacteria group bacterium]
MTLRRWDTAGVLVPARTSGNQRLYSKEQLDQFKKSRVANSQILPVENFDESSLSLPQVSHASNAAAHASNPSASHGSSEEGSGQGAATVLQNQDELTSLSYRSVSENAQTLHNRVSQLKQQFHKGLPVFVIGSSLLLLLVAGFIALALGGKTQQRFLLGKQNEIAQNVRENAASAVLAARKAVPDFFFRVSVPTNLEQGINIVGDINATGSAIFYSGLSTNNQDINAGTGSVFAANIPEFFLTGVSAGTGIGVTEGGTSPTISNTGVLSLQGSTGALTLTAGSGISLDGLKITNTNTAASGVTTIQESDTTVTSAATTLDFLGGDFDLTETPSGEANIQLAATLSSVTGVLGNFAIAGTTGLTLSGAGADSTFSGSGTHTISASSGTLELGAVTLAGTVTFSSFTSNGGPLYTNGSGVLAQATAGTAVQCLLGGTTPTFGSCATGVNQSNWEVIAGAITPKLASTLDFLLGSTATSSAEFAVTGINDGTPTATISATTDGNGLSLTGSTATLQSLRNNTLTIGGATTGNIAISPLNGSGTTLNTGNFNLSTGKTYQIAGADVLSSTTLGTGVTGSSLTSVGTIATGVWQGTSVKADFGGTGLTTYATGDLLYSGSINPTALSKLIIGTANQVLTVSGGLPTWADAGTQAFGLWDQSLGAIYPKNSTVDLLLGGTSTASAKFGFLNVNSGTPTASISANTGNNALYITGDGKLATVNRASLTIGDSTSTGDVIINPAGNVGVGDTSPAALFTVGSGDKLQVGSGGNITFNNVGTEITVGSGEIFNVSASGGDTATFTRSDAGVNEININAQASNQVGLTLQKDGADKWSIYSSSSSDNLSFYDTTDRLTIEATTGEIGINDTTPDAQLEVINDGSGDSFLVADTNDGDTTPFVINSSGNVGIGTTSPLATLDVRGNSGTTPAASISATSSFAAMVVDNNGVGDLFTASSSGYTRFVVTQNGDVGVGTMMPESLLEIQGLEARDAILTLDADDGDDTADTWFIESEAADNDLSFVNNTSEIAKLTTAGAFHVGDLVLGLNDTSATITTADTEDITIDPLGDNVILPDTVLLNGGGIGAVAYNAFADSATSVDIADGDSDLFIGDELEVNGAVRLDSTVTLGSGSFNSCTALNTSSSGVVGCATTTLGSNWDVVSGAISPKLASTLDFLLGSTATSSAEFGVTGINDGTPTATISATTTGNGLSLTGSTATLQSLRNNQLVLGGSTTGNIILSPLNGSGNVGIGTTSPTYRLSVDAGDSSSGAPTTIGFVNTPSGTYYRFAVDGSDGLQTGNGQREQLYGYWGIELRGHTENVPPPSFVSGTGSDVGVSIINTLTGSKALAVLGASGQTANLQEWQNSSGNAFSVVDSAGKFGIGTTSNSLLGTLDVRALSSTLPVASISGSTNFAALVVDNRGTGDLFTASSSGLNRFVITQGGNVGIGTRMPTDRLEIANGGLVVSDPRLTEKSTLTDGVGITNLLNPDGIFVLGKYAYVTSNADHALNIVDVSNPSAPTEEGTIVDGTGATKLAGALGVFVVGKYAYVTSNTDSALTVIDISNPTSPTEVGTIVDGTGATQLSGAAGVYVSGKYAYVVSITDDSLSVIDISNPTSPTEVGTIKDGVGATQLDAPVELFVLGKYAYVTAQTDNALSVIDISNPAVPTEVGTIKDGVGATRLAGARGVYVSGKYAYVVSSTDNALSIFDVSNPASISEIGTIVDGTGATQIAAARQVSVAGKYAYVTGQTDGALSVFDISTPASPVEVRTLVDGAGATQLAGAYSLYVQGNYAYVGAITDDAFTIINISGVESSTGTIGNLASNDINISNSLVVGNNAYISNGLNVGPGGIFSDGPLSVFATSSANPAIVSRGDVKIEAQTDSTLADERNWAKISQGTAGTIASAGTADIASISASVVYNGSLYVGTYKNNAGAAEVYRYDGSSLNWTKVTNATAGTITTSGTTLIGSVSAMTVFDGSLYIGTSKKDAAEVYRYESGTTWRLVSQATAGTILAGGTATIDGVSSLVVYHGRLYAGTRDPVKAELYRLESGSTWSVVNSTPGTFVGTNAINVTAVTSMVVHQGMLYLGLFKTGDADVVLYDGGTSGSGGTFSSVNAASTTGSYFINGAAVTAFDEVTSMAVYNGNLVVGLQKLNGAEILVSNTVPSTSTDSWTRLGTAAGQVSGAASATTNIDGISALYVHNGVLYAGTREPNSAEIYRYEGQEGKWVKVSQTTAGTIASGGTAAIDMVTMLNSYNDTLFAGTHEIMKAEVYSVSGISLGKSYALKFHSTPVLGGGEQNSLENLGSIQFLASTSAQLNSAGGRTGSFLFSHSILTSTGAYDVAEDYPTRDETLEPGDIVSIDQNEREMVGKSKGVSDTGMIGVYSEDPGFRLSQKEGAFSSGTKTVPVAMVGRVPVKVSMENGAIKNGDPITVSSIPGIGMKATERGIIVGRALESYESADAQRVGKIMVYINVGWNDPNVFFGPSGNMVIAQSEDERYILQKESGEMINDKAAFAEAVIANLSGGKISAKTLDVSEKFSIKGKQIEDYLNEVLTASAQQAASQSAALNLQTDTTAIDQRLDDLGSLLDGIQNRLSQLESFTATIASGSALTTSFSSLSDISSTSGALSGGTDFDNLTVGGTLNVLGRTTVSDLGVTGNITAGLLSIDGLEGAINVIGEPLRLQPLGTDGIDILSGKVVIDKNGNMNVDATIRAKKVNTDKLEIATTE